MINVHHTSDDDKINIDYNQITKGGGNDENKGKDSVTFDSLNRIWIDAGIYKYEPKSEKPVYSIDTPPPTISGLIHVGHLYSYAQMDFIARYKRMQGFNIFYPFGYDENGLPTEVLIEKETGLNAERVGRESFIKAVNDGIKKYESMYREVWTSFGLSCDWSLLFKTISPEVQRISQLSFMKLYESGRVYKKDAPVIWCPKCKTTISQMDLEDKVEDSKFVTIKFSDDIEIATTRPELIFSCVAVFVNPDDKRYAKFVGKTVKVPLSCREVKIIADRRVDMSKGTGAVMCSTFGDQTYVEWYKAYNLDLVLSIDENMNMTIPGYEGMTLTEAREKVIKLIEEKKLVKKQRILSMLSTFMSAAVLQ